MSDLPGEMTKQILSAPPSTSRSTRYSLTARGRSRSPSRRLPTGSSSFENASGCMRLPCPAAGTMPHIAHLALHQIGDSCHSLEQRLELGRADRGGVAAEGPLARRGGDPLALAG